MVSVLVILDGAAEDPGRGPTSLERARMPTLDALCAEGEVRARRTIPPGLRAGSEVGIPTLLGAELSAEPSRGRIEAAARGVEIPEGLGVWRVDAPREGAASLAAEAARLGLVPLRGHRFLFVGGAPPDLGPPWRVWPDGPGLPRLLDDSTVVVAAAGAAAGCARMLGARAIVPDGATGDVDTDYRAKAAAALEAMGEAARVVVHVGAPDEASHRRDAAAKVRALEAIDALLLSPLRAAAARRGATLEVCPDHGTDPRTGAHLAGPVPAVRWGPGIVPSGPNRLSERATRGVATP
jgi:2,3-bisphosphoglycerate-independent phosphoglycerate mutase